ncbi:MAG: response regulator [Bacilli bacterium]|jgi:two-component system response regulator YesN|nr:response regulator [Bacilli bacterium]
MYKVLIVEDEEIIRKGLIFSFDWARSNCTVIGEAANGQEGLKKILSEQPDIVITDIKMPILSGIEMIKRGKISCSFTAIVLSGYSDFDYAKEAIRIGVTDYLLKPLNNDDLANALENAEENVDIMRNYEKLSNKLADMSKAKIVEDVDVENTPLLVKQVLDYLQKNYAKKILLEEIAEQVISSVTTINDVFKKEMGVTIHDYLLRLRIQKSIDLMKKGELHLYQISDLCGFNDTKYFRKVFRKYTGVSSTKFMEIVSGKEMDFEAEDGEEDEKDEKEGDEEEGL